jgi:hypothetical protein
MLGQQAEAPAVGKKIIGGQVLVSHDDDVVVEPGLVELRERGIMDRRSNPVISAPIPSPRHRMSIVDFQLVARSSVLESYTLNGAMTVSGYRRSTRRKLRHMLGLAPDGLSPDCRAALTSLAPMTYIAYVVASLGCSPPAERHAASCIVVRVGAVADRSEEER